MFITIQFPFIDLRGLSKRNNISLYSFVNDERGFSKPEGSVVVPYIGCVYRRKQYSGPWDGEDIYCQAINLFNLCGLGNQNFYLSLKSKSKSEILFRRFQTDGEFLVKFDIGFNDKFEDLVKNNDHGLRLQIHNHVRDYLNCKIKIKVGNSLSEYVNLYESQKFLSGAYYRSGFPEKSKNRQKFDNLEKIDPIILIQIDRRKVNLQSLEALKIKGHGLEEKGIDIYIDHVYYSQNNISIKIKIWIIAIDENSTTLPLRTRKFRYYNHHLRNLRINLLRVHVEKNVLEILLDKINDYFPKHEEYDSYRFVRYIQKRIHYLSSIKNNKLHLDPLFDAAFKIEEENSTLNLDRQLNSIEFLLNYLKNERYLNELDKSRFVNYITKIENTMGDKITIGSIHGSFINKSTLSNSLNKISELEKNDAEIRQALLTIAKRIEELKDPVSSAVFNSFTEEVDKPQEKQNKSKLNTLWNSLMKTLPDLVTLGKIMVPILT